MVLSNFKKYINRLFHQHEWVDIEKITQRVFWDEYSSLPEYYKYIFIQRCKVCGKIRKIKIKT